MGSQMTAFQQTMTVQAQITENIATDTSNLASLSNRSQSARARFRPPRRPTSFSP
jgi:conjugal transfer/entry exclusion protein